MMIIRLALKLMPRNRGRQFNTTTVPQFSTLLIETIYPYGDYSDDIELQDTPVDASVVLPLGRHSSERARGRHDHSYDRDRAHDRTHDHDYDFSKPA